MATFAIATLSDSPANAGAGVLTVVRTGTGAGEFAFLLRGLPRLPGPRPGNVGPDRPVSPPPADGLSAVYAAASDTLTISRNAAGRTMSSATLVEPEGQVDATVKRSDLARSNVTGCSASSTSISEADTGVQATDGVTADVPCRDAAPMRAPPTPPRQFADQSGERQRRRDLHRPGRVGGCWSGTSKTPPPSPSRPPPTTAWSPTYAGGDQPEGASRPATVITGDVKSTWT